MPHIAGILMIVTGFAIMAFGLFLFYAWLPLFYGLFGLEIGLLVGKSLTGTVAQTAPVFLTGFVTSQGLFLAKVCAAAVVVSLPVLIAGFAAQDKLVQGLSLGAVK